MFGHMSRFTSTTGFRWALWAHPIDSPIWSIIQIGYFCRTTDELIQIPKGMTNISANNNYKARLLTTLEDDYIV
jgi:hypothetical protein